MISTYLATGFIRNHEIVISGKYMIQKEILWFTGDSMTGYPCQLGSFAHSSGRPFLCLWCSPEMFFVLPYLLVFVGFLKICSCVNLSVFFSIIFLVSTFNTYSNSVLVLFSFQNSLLCVLLVACAMTTCIQAFSMSHSFRCAFFCKERYKRCITTECDGYDGVDVEVDDCAAICRERLYVCPRSCAITRRGK